MLSCVLLLLLAASLGLVSALAPIQVVANVRGKRFEVSAESVEEVSKQVEALTGIKTSEQNILYKGKVLNASDKLEEMGITAGEVLNVVKGRRVRPPTPSVSASPSTASSPVGSPPAPFDPSTVDPEKLKEAAAAMETLLDSNAIEEYFSNEERIEQARQELLSNLDEYEKMMPGFKQQAQEIASDPAKWKEAMANAKQQLMRLKEQRDAMRASQPQQQQAQQQPQHPAESSVDDVDE